MNLFLMLLSWNNDDLRIVDIFDACFLDGEFILHWEESSASLSLSKQSLLQSSLKQHSWQTSSHWQYEGVWHAVGVIWIEDLSQKLGLVIVRITELGSAFVLKCWVSESGIFVIVSSCQQLPL